MNRQPTYDKIHELLKYYHGCNERILNPINRLVLDFMKVENLMKLQNWEINQDNKKRFYQRLQTYHHYYYVYFDVKTNKIIVFDKLKKRIEKEF